MVVQPVGGDALRLAFHRDAIGLAVGRAGDAVVALDRRMAGNLQPEGQILPRPVAQHRPSVRRLQDEGGDDRTRTKEHTPELQSLIRTPYPVLRLNTKTTYKI